jgi:dTDP-4-dehydrorhamnose reductase
MRIVIFGCTGMLGRYVHEFFTRQNYNVIGFSRADLDIVSVNTEKLISLGLAADDVVINCAGLIKQRTDENNLNFIIVNSVFPLLLSKVCDELGCRLIHITTDCVFSGMDGDYNEFSPHDATDIYGQTKSLGEPMNVAVIRTSIIGEEKGQALSLVEWVKSNRDSTVNGYTNHFWNGITCLQFAKVCEYMIKNNLFWRGVKHITSPTTVNKFELVSMLSDIYDLNITVTPFETPEKCDRSMSSIRDDIEISIPELEVQIREMRDF